MLIPKLPPKAVGCKKVDPLCCDRRLMMRHRRFRRANRKYALLAVDALNVYGRDMRR